MYSTPITWLQQGEFLDTNFNFKTWMFNLSFVLFNSILKLLLKYFLFAFLSYFFSLYMYNVSLTFLELNYFDFFVFVKMEVLL